MTAKKRNFLYENSLSISLFLFFLIILIGQIAAGLKEYNSFLEIHGMMPVNLSTYLSSGHFLQSTFENWESEFLQMFAYVLMTVHLRQRGSAESKPIGKQVPVDRNPRIHKTAPWPVKKGGWILSLYKRSLSIALFFLFLVSFALHAYGSFQNYLIEQHAFKQVPKPFSEFLFDSKIWFESFQNWQSEFLSVFTIVILSIFLRHQGSPESKPVDMAHLHNEA